MSSLRSLTEAYDPPQAGEIVQLPFNADTTGYLKCDGSVVSQATYSSLFAQTGLIADGSLINTWETRTLYRLPPGGTVGDRMVDPLRMTYADGTYVIGGSGAFYLVTSTDGATWTARTVTGLGANTTLYTVTYGGGLFMGCGIGNFGIFITSTDAVTWTVRSIDVWGTLSYVYAATYGNNLYVACGQAGRLATSTDTITWTLRSVNGTNNLFSVTYSATDDLYVCTGSGGFISTSTDAITWTRRTSGLIANMLYSIYANNIYMVSGASGYLATSTDAITWTARTVGTITNYNQIAYGNNIFMLAGGNSSTPTSTDGITWTVRTIGVVAPVAGVAYADNLFLYCGSGAGTTAAGVAGFGSYYSYNTASDFALPSQDYFKTDSLGYNLYIKT